MRVEIAGPDWGPASLAGGRGCGSGCPALLPVHVLGPPDLFNVPLLVPLFRALIGRASCGTDGADRDYEASPEEGEHPKHREHTNTRRNGGAGLVRNG